MNEEDVFENVAKAAVQAEFGQDKPDYVTWILLNQFNEAEIERLCTEFNKESGEKIFLPLDVAKADVIIKNYSRIFSSKVTRTKYGFYFVQSIHKYVGASDRSSSRSRSNGIGYGFSLFCLQRLPR